jgi:5S rRNA maturation endonuclease (ribonuclease M5)
VNVDEKLEKLAKMMDQLKDGWIFVEGQKDKKALAQLGLDNVLTISGNLRQSCQKIVDKKVDKVYVLTDLDRRGYQLALMARDELEGLSVKADISLRGELGHMLGIKNFENAQSAFEKMKEEYEKEKQR